MRMNRVMGAVTVVLTGVLGVASLAWACANVVSPFVTATPNHGLAASVTTVSGGNWAASSNLTLHWATVDGQVLTTTATDVSGRFSARITVPADAAPSVYYVVAVQSAVPADNVRRAPFEVTAPAGTSTDPGQDNGNPAGNTLGSTSGGTGSSTPASSAGSGGTSAGAVAGSGGLPTNDALPSSGNGPISPSDQRQVTSPAPTATNNAITPGPAPAAERRQGSGVALGTRAPAVATPAAAASTDQDNAVPLASSATGDVWGGFAEGPDRLAPSLVDLPATVGSTSPVAVGGVAAVLALVGLMGGFATAEFRRRRALVSGGSGR